MGIAFQIVRLGLNLDNSTETGTVLFGQKRREIHVRKAKRFPVRLRVFVVILERKKMKPDTVFADVFCQEK